ncbi:MAG: RIP metalloprotease RseP [Prevotella sp.]|nr:RIP metalloprotease RseP [Prevotella sp.]
MEIFIIRLIQFVLAISLLVLIHEFGHFFFSKLFGIRVEKFYIFFDPWFHLFEYKPKNSHTRYGVGWLPLGGYCKISGMIDESFDKEQMKQPPQPWEFRTKPAWQRLLVMVGGVMMNFLLAIFIYSMILFSWGDSYIATKDMTHGMAFNSDAKALGFKDGDILVGTEKGAFKEFGVDMFRDISEAHKVDIVRNGQPMTISLPGELNLLSMIKNQPMFARPFIPAVADSVIKGSAADKMGMVAGDKIVAINGKKVGSWNEFTDEIARFGDMLATAKTPVDSMKARSTTIVIEHDARLDTADVVLSPELTFGIYVKSLASLYEPTTIEYGFFESFPAGVKYGVNVLRGYVDDLKYVVTAEGAKSVGGFGAIASMFPATWDWYVFWKMTALLSIMLAFMNILPIPALDGGHVLFLLYEIITRRKPSENFLIYAEYAGFIFILALLIFANGNDILRWLGIMW